MFIFKLPKVYEKMAESLAKIGRKFSKKLPKVFEKMAESLCKNGCNFT